MESINENSDEFYRKKYLKYKQKYIDTLQLYSNELDGGRFGDEFFILVPYNIYKLVREIYNTPTDDNPTIINDIKGFFILLGNTSYKTFYTSKKLRKCSDNTSVDENFWLDSTDITKNYIGLGYFSDKSGKNKKKSIDEALKQATSATFGNFKKTLISNYRFFVIESVKKGGGILGGYSISFPLLKEQIKVDPVIIEPESTQKGVDVDDNEAKIIATVDRM
jgi:hypothetical protein